MKTLNELFNSKIKYIIKDNEATFSIGDVEYMVDWHPDGNTGGPDNDWQVAFGSRKLGTKDPWDINKTKDGNEFKVFSTVIKIVKDVMKKKKAFGITFTAKEPNRIKLYRKMVKRFKDWDTTEHNFAGEQNFYMTRKD